MRAGCYITNEAKKEYWKEVKLRAGESEDRMHVVNLYPEFQRQTIEGFGGAFTEAAADTFAKLSREAQEEILEAYFGESGLKYNMGRCTIHSCDFARGNYTYVEENDETLDSFSIDHDREQILPLIKRAMEKASEKMHFLASPWSPPAYMKTNGEMNHGGKLKEEYRALWAEYVTRFLHSYRDEGIDVKYITVQNEPEAVQTWDSCIYTAAEEGVFVLQYLAPALQKAELSDVGIFIWDHNKEAAFERADGTLSVPGTNDMVEGVAVHWYTGDHFDSLRLIREKYPDKRIFFTEGCVEYSRFADSNEVQKAEMYAHDMAGNFNAGVEAELDWNLILDENGGPNHVGNYCAAPIMCDTGTGTVDRRLTYYYIGHFSRYIRRGARSIATTAFTDKIDAAAFVNPNGERVTVLLNKSDEDLEITLRENGRGTAVTLPAHSLATVIFEESCSTEP
ncbi:MAG: glucosylceramidase [Lachnospiraceae bacterium]|nr:glucosylceramidase [Lachnospiraceae bacterium]